MNGHPRETFTAAELMGRTCDGDRAAFLALYQLMAPELLARLLQLAPDQAAAERLLQTTFMELHDRRSSYVRGADPLPWARVIAEHVAAGDRRPKGGLLRTVGRFVLARSSRGAPPGRTEAA
jgi:DNA-directed RNA polymerase specialized sigma24 family protein